MVNGIGPAWSLAVELVFYCVLPLLVLGAARAARLVTDRDGRVLILLGPPVLLLLIGLSGKHAAHLLPGSPTAGYGNNWHSVIERSFWAQADLFSFGMVVAVLHAEVTDLRLTLPVYWRRAAVAVGLLVFLPCAVTMRSGEQSYLVQNTGEAFAIALLLAVIVIPGPPGTKPLRLVRLLESRVFVAAGVVSYSVFLWHHPVIAWLQEHELLAGGWGGLFVNVVVTAAIVAVLSTITYRFVERPALRRKRSTRPPTGSDSRGAPDGVQVAIAPAVMQEDESARGALRRS